MLLQSNTRKSTIGCLEHKKYISGFRKLLAWQAAHELTISVYKETKQFPTDERFRLTDQLCRASSSIGAQIAEGSCMDSQKHRKLYYQRAYASAAEVDNHLELAHDLEYLDDETYEDLLKQVNRACYLIRRLTTALSPKTPPTPNAPNKPSSPSTPYTHSTPISRNHVPAAAH